MLVGFEGTASPGRGDLVIGWPAVAHGVVVGKYRPLQLDPLEEAILALARCNLRQVGEISRLLSVAKPMVQSCRDHLGDQDWLDMEGSLTPEGCSVLERDGLEIEESTQGFYFRDVIFGNWFPFFHNGPLVRWTQPADHEIEPIEGWWREASGAELREAFEVTRRERQLEKVYDEDGDEVRTLADVVEEERLAWVEPIRGAQYQVVVPIVLHPDEDVRGGIAVFCPYTGAPREGYLKWLSELPGGKPACVRNLIRTSEESRAQSLAAAQEKDRAAEIEEKLKPKVDQQLPGSLHSALAHLRQEMIELEDLRLRAAKGNGTAGKSIPRALRVVVEAVAKHTGAGVALEHPAERLFGRYAAVRRNAEDEKATLRTMLEAKGIVGVPSTVINAMRAALGSPVIQVERGYPREVVAGLFLHLLTRDRSSQRSSALPPGLERLMAAQKADPKFLDRMMHVVFFGNDYAHPNKQVPPTVEELDRVFDETYYVLNALAVG